MNYARPDEPPRFEAGDLLYDEEYKIYSIVIEVFEDSKEYYLLNIFEGTTQAVMETYVDLHQPMVRKMA